MLRDLYHTLPSQIQPIIKKPYRHFATSSQENTNEELINDLFHSKEEYRNHREGFEESGTKSLIENKVRRFRQEVDSEKGGWAGIGLKSAELLYSIVSKYEPENIIETGVCNGVSSLVILSALDENGSGDLYSIDYPMYANEPLPEFRKTAYPDGHAFSAIPANKEPGWIIPENLKQRWDLRVGKSQQKLPILLSEIDNLDVFIHDSEHTFPCMMFEYELAWERLNEDGILLSDDVSRNNSFRKFTDVREPKCFGVGSLGYMRR